MVLLMDMILSMLLMLMTQVSCWLFWITLEKDIRKLLKNKKNGSSLCRIQMEGILLSILTRWKTNTYLSGHMKFQESLTVLKFSTQALLMSQHILWKVLQLLVLELIIQLFKELLIISKPCKHHMEHGKEDGESTIYMLLVVSFLDWVELDMTWKKNGLENLSNG